MRCSLALPRLAICSAFALLTLAYTGCTQTSNTPNSASGSQENSNRSQSLSRQLALGLINDYKVFTTVSTLALADPRESVNGGIQEGLWTQDNFGPLPLTQDGQKFFSAIGGFPDYRAALVRPTKRVVVEVTGIADHPEGAAFKEVKFHWKYQDLDDLVARYTGQGKEPHESQALLRLYDDGWRVERVEATETSRVPFRIDSGRIEDAESARRETANRERAAKTFARVIGEYQFAVTPPDNIRSPDPTYNTYAIRVTDVDVTVRETPFNPNFRPGSRTLGFWQISSVQLGRPTYAQQGAGLTIESINGSLRVYDNSGNSQGFQALQQQLQTAIASWNERYPDHNTWLPAESGSPAAATVSK